MPLVYACICPHGGETIPSLAGRKLRMFDKTRTGMRVMGNQMRKAGPATIVVATPHNLRMPRDIGVVVAEHSSGVVRERGASVKMKVDCDVEFGKAVLGRAEQRGIPVVEANYGTLGGTLSDLAMDWGTLIPLWFLRRGAGLKSKVLIVTPARGIPLRHNYEFGKTVAEAAEDIPTKVAFVASADQAHAHRKSGPYGHDARAKEYDERIVKAIEGDRLSSVMEIEETVVDGAKPDSLWQMAMLAGALSVVPMKGTLISYEVPTYYGLLCASYERV